ncbi:MAG: ABC transporter permease [Acidobacteria bacterium]|nr:MAG: ABC transporter permease [Acidobacteriota bacterium]
MLAVVLVVVELGLFVGFTVTTSSLIDHSGADLWIVSKHVPYVEMGVPFSERKLNQVKALEGVTDAERYVVWFALWKRPDGRQESVQVVGLNPNAKLGLPWNLVAGTAKDLRNPDAILIDELYKAKLGVERTGEVFEINDRRARVVGFTRGIHSFTTSPYIFTSFKRALDYSGLPETQTVYILVRVAPGELEHVRQAILSRVKDVDVYTSSEFGRMTQVYWMFTTGAGLAVLLAAILGLVVGFVVVAQTIYATTLDHLREFGTLKAMGAPNRFIHKLIAKQAALSAAMGYAIGMPVSLVVVRVTKGGGAAILLSWPMAIAIFFLTLLLCIAAGMVAIHKISRLDPAVVFKL